MTFDKKWQIFNRHAQFNHHLKWVRIALFFIKKNAPLGPIEFSFKNTGNNIFFNRLSIRFKDNQKSHYEDWYQEILKIGACWKIVWPDQNIQSFFNNFDWSMSTSFWCGFDLRKKIEDSRLKMWCALRANRKTIQGLIKHCSFDNSPLFPYWKEYASDRILFGWVYSGNGDVSWRVYPEIPAQPFILKSKKPIVQKLGALSELLASSFPSSQSIMIWGKIKDKEKFLKALSPFLCCNRAIALAKDFQKQGFILNNVATTLALPQKNNITEANFYFI